MKLLLIGSASVHTWRYLAGIAPHVEEIWLALQWRGAGGQAPGHSRASCGWILA
jgi:hypothetical protein